MMLNEMKKAKVVNEKMVSDYDEQNDTVAKVDPSADIGRLLCEAKSDEEENEILAKYKLKKGSVEGDFAAMMAIYYSTNGDGWKKNRGWNGDAPDWYGVKLNKKYRVIEISLPDNGLSGNLPRSIHLLTKLNTLVLQHNPDLKGQVPVTLAHLRNITKLSLSDTGLLMPISDLSIASYGMDPNRSGTTNVDYFLKTLLFSPTKSIVLSHPSKLGIKWNQCEVSKVTDPTLEQEHGVSRGWVVYKIDGIKLSEIPENAIQKEGNNTGHSFLIQSRLKQGPSVLKKFAHLRNPNQGIVEGDGSDSNPVSKRSVCFEFVCPSPWLFSGVKNDNYFLFDALLGYKLEQVWSETDKTSVILSKYETDVTSTCYEYDLTQFKQYRLSKDNQKNVSTMRSVKRSSYGYVYPHRSSKYKSSDKQQSHALLDIRAEEAQIDKNSERDDNEEDDDIYEFDYANEPLLPTKVVGEQGGLIGCDPSTSFGSSMLAPPGALPRGVELCLSKGKTEKEESTVEFEENGVHKSNALGVQYDSVVNLEVMNSGGESSELKLPVSMQLQHAFVLNSSDPHGDAQQFFVVSRTAANQKWERIANATISDKYAVLTLSPGPIPSHVAIQSNLNNGDGASVDYQNTNVAVVVVYAKLDPNEKDVCNDGLMTVWVLPNRDDARQAVHQRMERRNPVAAWNVVSESIEDLIVERNGKVSICIDGNVEEKIFKSEQGACFHCLISNNQLKGTDHESHSPFARLTVCGYEDSEVDLFLPRPAMKVKMTGPPPMPELIYRDDGGSLTIKLLSSKKAECEKNGSKEKEDGDEEAAVMIVDIAKLQVRDCADVSGQLVMPLAPPNDVKWETVYEGGMTVCMVEGGFASFVRSRYARGGPWSAVLSVPPPGSEPTEKNQPAKQNRDSMVINCVKHQELLAVVSSCHRTSVEVKDPNLSNCQFLAHRVACALSSLGNIPQILFSQDNLQDLGIKQSQRKSKKENQLFSDLMKALKSAESLIQASASEGWLSRVLWPSMGGSDTFTKVDEQIVASVLELAFHYDEVMGRNSSDENEKTAYIKAKEVLKRRSGGKWYVNMSENGMFQLQRQQLCSILLRSSPPPLEDSYSSSTDSMIVNGFSVSSDKPSKDDKGSTKEGSASLSGALSYAQSLAIHMGLNENSVGSEEVTNIRFHQAYQRLLTSVSPFPIHKLSSTEASLNTSDLSIPSSSSSFSCSATPTFGDSDGNVSVSHSPNQIPSIFISYAREDKDVSLFATKLAEAIRSSGAGNPILSFQNQQVATSLKIDPSSKNQHKKIVPIITNMVKSCDVFFAVLSGSYGHRLLSPCSSLELTLADQVLVPIIPIKISVSSPGPLYGVPTANCKLEIDFSSFQPSFADSETCNKMIFIEKLEQLCKLMCPKPIPSLLSVCNSEFMGKDVEATRADECEDDVDRSELVGMQQEVHKRSISEFNAPTSVVPAQVTFSHSVSDSAASLLTSSSQVEPLKDDKEGETLEAWLMSLRLGHILPTLQTLGAEELSDLEYLDDDDIGVLSLRPIERRKFEKAKKIVLAKLGVSSDDMPPAPKRPPTRPDDNSGDSSPRPKVAKRLDMAIQKSSDPVDGKVWRAEVFGSMRFDACGPARRGGEAEQLRKALEDQGIKLHIVDISAGASITLTVFEIMERCHGFIAFGTKTYGANTGNPAATDREVAYWQGVVQQSSPRDKSMTAQAMAEARPLIPIRMIEFDERFQELAARVLFGINALSIQWSLGTPMPKDVVSQILRALRLSELSTPIKELDYKDPSHPKLGSMLDELEKSSLPMSNCLVYWYGTPYEASQALRSGIYATSKHVYESSSDTGGVDVEGVFVTKHRPCELDDEDSILFPRSKRKAVLVCSVPCRCLKDIHRLQLDDVSGFSNGTSAVCFIPRSILTALRGFDCSTLIDPQPWLQHRVMVNPKVIIQAFMIENKASILGGNSDYGASSTSALSPEPLSTNQSQEGKSSKIADGAVSGNCHESSNHLIEDDDSMSDQSLNLLKPSNMSELLDIMKRVRSECDSKKLACVCQYRYSKDMAFIVRNGITCTSTSELNTIGSGKILFTTQSPFSNEIGTSRYQQIIRDIHNNDEIDGNNNATSGGGAALSIPSSSHSSGCSSEPNDCLSLVVIYGCDPDILVPQPYPKTSSIFAVNNSFIHSLALLDRDGKFFLRKNRILALIEIDPLSECFARNSEISQSSEMKGAIEEEKLKDELTLKTIVDRYERSSTP